MKSFNFHMLATILKIKTLCRRNEIPSMGQFATSATFKYLENRCAEENIDRFLVNPGVEEATWRSILITGETL